MVLPLVWIAASAVTGVVTGLVYEKESNKKVVEDISVAARADEGTYTVTWADKALMAAAGIAAFYIYRSTR